MPRFEIPDPIVDNMTGREFINLIQLCKLFPHQDVATLAEVSKRVYGKRTLSEVLDFDYFGYSKAGRMSLRDALESKTAHVDCSNIMNP